MTASPAVTPALEPADSIAASAADLRLAVPATAAWIAAAAVLGKPSAAGPAAVALLAAGAGSMAIRRSGVALLCAAALFCASAAALSAGLSAAVARPKFLARLAAAGSVARVRLVVTGDPVPLANAGQTAVRGRPLVRLDARLVEITAVGRATRLRAPVLVLAPLQSWSRLLPSQHLVAAGRLSAPRAGDLISAVLLARGPPTDVSRPSSLQRMAASIRTGLRSAVRPLPRGPAGLLPGLVIGDTGRLPPEVVAEFRATGLTHLVAVSGANLAIVIGTVLALTRRLGAGRRLAGMLAVASMLAFVVVARPSPSVLRAAVMSAVVLAGVHLGRRSAPVPALAAAMLGLVLLDPPLSRSPGFALSVLATAGIVLLARPLQDRMPKRLPRWLATALAVPLAAQIACTPVQVALFGRLSVVAIPANVLAGPAVASATLIGVVLAIVAPVSLPVAHLLSRLAEPPTGWLLLVAHRGAELPGAQVGWPTGLAGAALGVTAMAAAAAALRRWLLRRLVIALVLSALIGAGVGTRTGSSWPPSGWAFVACDVGQGDGLVLSAGPGAGIVVDTGPDPALIDRCLRQLRVRTVPLVVLSHLHADHVEGLPGVLRHRTVAAVEVGPLDEPAAESARVRRWAAAVGVPVVRALDGEQRRVAELTWQVLAPSHAFSGTDSDPNNSSLVLRVRFPGFTALLTGDIEVAAQQELLTSGYDVSADVLKVPHHGSARQDPALLDRVGERLAVASLGADNDYGHPAPSTMSRLAADGAHAFRTDRDGSVAVVRRGDSVVAVGRHGSGAPASGRHLAGRLATAPAAAGSVAAAQPAPAPVRAATAALGAAMAAGVDRPGAGGSRQVPTRAVGAPPVRGRSPPAGPAGSIGPPVWSASIGPRAWPVWIGPRAWPVWIEPRAWPGGSARPGSSSTRAGFACEADRHARRPDAVDARRGGGGAARRPGGSPGDHRGPRRRSGL